MACLTLLKAKDLQIVVHFNNINIEENTDGIKIAEVLENKLMLQVALVLKKLNITLINQLINKEGNKMISWQQLKLLRKESSKSRPAS